MAETADEKERENGQADAADRIVAALLTLTGAQSGRSPKWVVDQFNETLKLLGARKDQNKNDEPDRHEPDRHEPDRHGPDRHDKDGGERLKGDAIRPDL